MTYHHEPRKPTINEFLYLQRIRATGVAHPRAATNPMAPARLGDSPEPVPAYYAMGQDRLRALRQVAKRFLARRFLIGTGGVDYTDGFS